MVDVFEEDMHDAERRRAGRVCRVELLRRCRTGLHLVYAHTTMFRINHWQQRRKRPSATVNILFTLCYGTNYLPGNSAVSRLRAVTL